MHVKPPGPEGKLEWKEIVSSLNWLRLKYMTFANFTKTYHHVKLQLEQLPGPWKLPAQIGEEI